MDEAKLRAWWAHRQGLTDKGVKGTAADGLAAGVGMFSLAANQHNPLAVQLSLRVVAAMAVSCLVSGVCGAFVPLTRRRLGADPALPRAAS